MQTTTMHASPSHDHAGARRLLRRLGTAGFAFFLVKGLLWLIVPAAIWLLRG